MTNTELKAFAFVIVLIGAVVAFWSYREELAPSQEVAITAPPEPVLEPVPEQAAPLHPVAPVEAPASGNIEELPPLDDSDGGFLAALVDTLGAGVESLLVNEALIDRFVATVDNLPRKQVSEKIRPVGRLATEFSAAATDDDASFVLGSENFKRYDALVDLLANADVDAVVAMYQRYYPLLQEAYERLGYPNDYFNDRVVEVIDHLLLTPEPSEPVQLVRPNVLFEFADPELEALSSGQKLLLRTGNENASRLKQVLKAWRLRLVSLRGQVDSNLAIR